MFRSTPFSLGSILLTPRSVAASLELSAAALGIGANVHKAVLRAAGIDLADTADEKTADYHLARLFARQAMEKSGVYEPAARQRMCGDTRDKVFIAPRDSMKK